MGFVPWSDAFQIPYVTPTSQTLFSVSHMKFAHSPGGPKAGPSVTGTSARPKTLSVVTRRRILCVLSDGVYAYKNDNVKIIRDKDYYSSHFLHSHNMIKSMFRNECTSDYYNSSLIYLLI